MDSGDNEKANKEPKRYDEGLMCPDCHCRDLRVYATRRRGDGVLRIRFCRHCNRRIITRERIS
jgi:hypothetical protein